MAFTIKPGDIIIVNNWNGNFLSKAIRFFTKSWSHTAVGFFDIPRNPLAQQTIFESNLLTGITSWEKTFDDPNCDVRIYRWKKKVNITPVLWSVYDSYNGNTYGAWQLLYFVWSWLVNKMHLPKRWAKKNFFPNLEICTEILYQVFSKLDDTVVNGALGRLGKDQNTVHPGDIILICEDLCRIGVVEVVYNRERK